MFSSYCLHLPPSDDEHWGLAASWGIQSFPSTDYWLPISPLLYFGPWRIMHFSPNILATNWLLWLFLMKNGGGNFSRLGNAEVSFYNFILLMSYFTYSLGTSLAQWSDSTNLCWENSFFVEWLTVKSDTDVKTLSLYCTLHSNSKQSSLCQR